MKTVNLTINGKAVSAVVEARTHLADFLRESLLLTGTHTGCEHGVCGACTLLIDGAPARSCITYAVACHGAEITTIEGLNDDAVTGQLRAAFSREHGLQCGYCTPGMLMTARDIVIRLPDADERRVRFELSGNLCRCTGYVGIVRAICGVLAERRKAGLTAANVAARVALGPVGSGHGVAAAASAMPARPAPPVTRPASAPAPSPGFSAAAAAKPGTTIRQSFTVDHPRERVWAFFQRIDQVVECMPGAALTAPPQQGRLSGRIRIRLGPISTDFAGDAEIDSDPAGYRGSIRGSGRDARSSSATTGEVRYALLEAGGGAQTRVDIEVGYTLTGTLAQFSRAAIVNDLAGRLTAAFAANLAARLDREARGATAPSGAPQAAAELDAGSLVLAALWARLKAFFARLFRREQDQPPR